MELKQKYFDSFTSNKIKNGFYIGTKQKSKNGKQQGP